MAQNRLIGDYPVIGIRPTIDGRRGKIKVRESLEDQTMNMAKAAAKLIEENVFYSNSNFYKKKMSASGHQLFLSARAVNILDRCIHL